MFPLIETIKVLDGQPYHLEWHQQRLEHAFKELFHARPAYHIADILFVPDNFTTSLVKARLLYNVEEYEWQFEPQVEAHIQSLKLVYDQHIDYQLKYRDRSHLENLYKKRDRCDDILIVKNDMITDTFYCNIVLFDGKKWVTPKFPLLKGTCRARLLSDKMIEEEIIRPADLKSYKYFKLINAMRDFEDAQEIPVSSIY
jgi:4-amino-4-deoxychorismate lyase